MAEDKDESQEKTQDPTSRRIEKAREDGKVVSSKEMYVFTILTAGVILMYLAPAFIEDFLKITKSFFSFGPELVHGTSPLAAIGRAIFFVVKFVLIFAIPVVIVCLLTQFLVGGINFSVKSMHWKFEKMNPLTFTTTYKGKEEYDLVIKVGNTEIPCSFKKFAWPWKYGTKVELRLYFKDLKKKSYYPYYRWNST